MHLLTSLSMCLICSATLAQQPTNSTAPPPPPDGGLQQGSQPSVLSGPGTNISQRSRVRAFHAGPDGQIRSVYLTNGTVVDLAGFGPGLNAQLHKGSHIRVTGVQTTVNGQTIVTPQQLMVGQQTFTVRPIQGPVPQVGAGPQPYGQPPAGPAGLDAPPPPSRGPAAPPPPSSGPGAPPPSGGPPSPPPPGGPARQRQATPGAPRTDSPTPVPPPQGGSQPTAAAPPTSTSPGSMVQPPSPTMTPNQ